MTLTSSIRRTVRALRKRFGFVAGLAAVYVPVVVVLAAPWPVGNKVLTLVSCWAIEGIAWLWRAEHASRRRVSPSRRRASA